VCVSERIHTRCHLTNWVVGIHSNAPITGPDQTPGPSLAPLPVGSVPAAYDYARSGSANGKVAVAIR
jgi:hypothetical protein